MRGERLDYLQVWDHRRERGGFVEASQVRRTALGRRRGARAAGGAALRARGAGRRGARHRRRRGLSAGGAGRDAARRGRRRGVRRARHAWPIGWRSASSAGAAPGDAGPSRGGARGAPRSRDAATASTFASFERDGAMRICYDGEAFRRVLALPAEPQQQRARRARPDAARVHRPGAAGRERAAARRAGAPTCSTASTPAELPATLAQPGRDAPRRRLERARLPARAPRRAAAAAGGGAARAGRAGRRRRAASSPTTTRPATTTPRSASAPRAGRRRRRRRGAGAAQACASSPSPGEPGETCVLLVDAKRERRRAARAALHLRRSSGRGRRRSTAKAMRSRSRCSRWRPGASSGCSAARAARLGDRRCCRRRRVRPAWATPSSPAGCRAAGRCWSRARRAAKAGPKRSFEVVRPRRRSAPSARPATRRCSAPFQRWQDPAWKRETVSMR